MEHPQGAEVLNWVELLARSTEPSPFSQFLIRWNTAIFTGLIVLLIGFFSISVSRKIKMIPARRQAFFEILISWLDDLVGNVMGSRGREYTPFVGSIFIYILVSNLLGLVPLQNSIMASLTTTAPLAICVFFYVQWVGITKNGFGGYLYHLCGGPKDVFGWLIVPLMFPLHILGEFVKPLSLSFRLYGNIMAGHLLLAAFLGMGIQILAPLHVPAGLPIHFPFLFLELLVGVIQAFVFALLSTIYIAMMLPHEEHGESGENHAAEAAHG
jgi:F-type H+-transporting ATPase subunit a